MSFNIKVTGSGGIVGNHPDVTSWLNTLSLIGGSASSTTIAALNTFCNSIDSAGLRSKFYRLNLFCGNNLTSCLVPLYVNTVWNNPVLGFSVDTNNNFVSGDYNETGTNGGLLGNGTSKYLNTGFLLNTFTNLAFCHLSAWKEAGTVSTGRQLIGLRSNLVGDDLYRVFKRGVNGMDGIWGQVNLAQPTGDPIYDLSGLLMTNRSSASRLDLYWNGTSVASSTILTTFNTSSNYFYVFADNASNNGAASSYWDKRLRSYSIGLSMDTTQVSNYYSIMNTFQTSLGRNV